LRQSCKGCYACSCACPSPQLLDPSHGALWMPTCVIQALALAVATSPTQCTPLLHQQSRCTCNTARAHHTYNGELTSMRSRGNLRSLRKHMLTWPRLMLAQLALGIPTCDHTVTARNLAVTKQALGPTATTFARVCNFTDRGFRFSTTRRKKNQASWHVVVTVCWGGEASVGGSTPCTLRTSRVSHTSLAHPVARPTPHAALLALLAALVDFFGGNLTSFLCALTHERTTFASSCGGALSLPPCLPSLVFAATRYSVHLCIWTNCCVVCIVGSVKQDRRV
jgi:hypothetical protein